MYSGSDYRFEFLNDEVLVLDSGAGVVHRLTGESAESVREANDEVSRRRAIKMALATGIGVATLALPTAAAASSGLSGSGGTGGTGPAAPVSLTVTTAMTSATALTATLSVGALESGHTYTYSVDGGGENVMASATVTTSSLTFASHTITVNKKLGGTVVSTATKTLTTSTASVSSSSAYSSSVLYGQGVRAVYASLIGGRGGRGGNDTFGFSTNNGGEPSTARDFTATVPIATTGTLTVNVGTGGANGQDKSVGTGGNGGAGGTNALAGFDGGNGGNAGTTFYSGGGGGGGAATVLTYNDGSTNTVLMVCPGSGGGGGAEWGTDGTNGFDSHSAVDGGGTSGEDGPSRGNTDTGGHGGGGGGAVGGIAGWTILNLNGEPGGGGLRGSYGGSGYTELSQGSPSRSIGQNGEASLKFVTVA